MEKKPQGKAKRSAKKVGIKDKGMVEVKVIGITAEPKTDDPLVWLKEKKRSSPTYLPIAIGSFEASAIHMGLTKSRPPRPITYDLLRSILGGVKVKLLKVHINALKEDTFYSEISLKSNRVQLEIDSRPSDAIALALRVGAPIFVSEEILNTAGVHVDKAPDSTALSSPDQLIRILKSASEKNVRRFAGLTSKARAPKKKTAKKAVRKKSAKNSKS